MTSVANPACRSTRATARLRGLKRPLPLPWANTMVPRTSVGTESTPATVTGPVGTSNSRSTIADADDVTVAGGVYRESAD